MKRNLVVGEEVVVVVVERCRGQEVKFFATVSSSN